MDILKPNKKILIISPILTHPATAGHKARVLDICLSFKEKGYDLDYLYLYKGKGENIEETKAFFGPDNFYSYKSRHRNYRSIFLPFLYTLAKKGIISSKKIFNYPIDYWFDEGIIDLLTTLSTENNYNTVIVEYVFYSKCLKYFPSKTKKVIDTHDKFANRWRIFYDNNIPPFGLSTSVTEEQKGLNRADITIAIQQNEAEYFRSICNHSVLTYGFKIRDKVMKKQPFTNKLLFIASNHALNNKGIIKFLEESFPLVLKRNPSTQLVIGGSICSFLEKNRPKHPNIQLLGIVDKIKDFYSTGTIVINPMPSGTGLKIKSIEALSYSKYLVTTTSGAEGLEKGINKAFLVANNSKEFAHHIIEIIENEKLRQQLNKNIKLFIREWNKNIDENFNKLINFIRTS